MSSYLWDSNEEHLILTLLIINNITTSHSSNVKPIQDSGICSKITEFIFINIPEIQIIALKILNNLLINSDCKQKLLNNNICSKLIQFIIKLMDYQYPDEQNFLAMLAVLCLTQLTEHSTRNNIVFITKTDNFLPTLKDMIIFYYTKENVRYNIFYSDKI